MATARSRYSHIGLLAISISIISTSGHRPEQKRHADLTTVVESLFSKIDSGIHAFLKNPKAPTQEERDQKKGAEIVEALRGFYHDAEGLMTNELEVNDRGKKGCGTTYAAVCRQAIEKLKSSINSSLELAVPHLPLARVEPDPDPQVRSAQVQALNAVKNVNAPRTQAVLTALLGHLPFRWGTEGKELFKDLDGMSINAMISPGRDIDVPVIEQYAGKKGALEIGLFWIHEDVVYPFHFHEALEAYYILTGHTTIVNIVDGNVTLKTELQEGDWHFHAPGVPHALVAGKGGHLSLWFAEGFPKATWVSRDEDAPVIDGDPPKYGGYFFDEALKDELKTNPAKKEEVMRKYNTSVVPVKTFKKVFSKMQSKYRSQGLSVSFTKVIAFIMPLLLALASVFLCDVSR